jgi:hypothetical protein
LKNSYGAKPSQLSLLDRKSKGGFPISWGRV